MVRCSVCQNWKHVEGNTGVCEWIVGEGWADDEELAMLSDPGSLYTRSAFGCAEGKLREDAVIERLGQVSDG